MDSKLMPHETPRAAAESFVSRKADVMSVKSLIQEIRASVAAIFVLGIVLCGAYPLVVWGIGQVAFHHQANGSLIERDGKIVGSSLLAQSFTGEKYFHPRPSAAGDNGYDAANSRGSNLGPLSKKLSDQVKERVEAYRSENNLASGIKIPAHADTASGSGLDPHISVENAELQAVRVACARGISKDQIKKFIDQYTEYPQLGFLGDPAVNVLRLNLALDDHKEK